MAATATTAAIRHTRVLIGNMLATSLLQWRRAAHRGGRVVAPPRAVEPLHFGGRGLDGTELRIGRRAERVRALAEHDDDAEGKDRSQDHDADALKVPGAGLQ